MTTHRLFFLTLFFIILTACMATPVPPEVDISPQVKFTVDTDPAANINNFAVFSINVQDFSYPKQSALILDRIITLHETYNIPVDIYLTDVMTQIYAEQFPQLLNRLKTSPMVAISYHYRAPRPYANNFDWLGLQNMSTDEVYQTSMRYETHAVDPITGQTTDAPGGYQYVASLIGYNPYAASSLSNNARVDDAVLHVFKDLGAQMTVIHGEALNLGSMKKGLYIRPEHYDYKLFQNIGANPAQSFEAALTEAHNAQDAQAPYFVGLKMHDNDFFAEKSAWLTVYVDGGKRPDWDPSLQASLLSQEEQDAIWTMYEQTVIYITSQNNRLGVVNLPMILDMIQP